MKRSEAREALEREITKQNGQTGDADRVMNDGSVRFGGFVRNRFLPLKEAHWKEETSKAKKLLIQRDLIDPFDKIPLETFGHRQLPQARVAQARGRYGTPEAHLPGHTAHNCDAGPKEGYGEGRARRAPALSRGNHDGCVYAGDSEERAGDGRFHQCGVEEEIKVCAEAESKRGARGADRFSIGKRSKRFDTK
jgi:hypothetical protein